MEPACCHCEIGRSKLNQPDPQRKQTVYPARSGTGGAAGRRPVHKLGRRGMSAHFLPVAMVALFAAFTNEGCEFGSRNDDGRASFALVDGPAEQVDLVKLTVTRITLGYENGSVNLPIDPPVVIDNLLDFQGTNAKALLPLEEVRAGSYDWLRLYISERNDASLVRERDTGQEFPLRLDDDAASGTETRYLQLNQSFRIPDDEDARFTLVLDLRKALLKQESSYYLLRPTLRLA